MISKNKGHYDLCSTAEEWRVAITLPADAPKRCLVEMWPADEEPDIEGLPPSEVAELMEERLSYYLLSTKREEHLAVIAWIRDHAERLDNMWARGRIKQLESRITNLRQYLADGAVTKIEEEPK